MTPLHWAVERGHIPVITCLLTYNADTHSCSKFNKTPIDIAEENCRMDIMQILREHIAFRKKNPKGISLKKVPIKVMSKGPRMILPKPQALLPINIIKKESLSDIKNLVNRTIVTSSLNNNNATSSSMSTSSAKIIKSAHPVVLHTNLAGMKDSMSEDHKNSKLSSREYEGGDTSDQSCTNVLATLAALAEATAPNATISTQEAVQWLELHGITMLPSDNSTIVATALEGGQSVSLTEAGKLALTWVKEQKDFNSGSSAEGSCSGRNKALSTVAVTAANQQVITIVADKSHIPSIISSQKQPIVMLSRQRTNLDNEIPPMKKVKIQEDIKPITNGKVIAIDEDERLLLQKELEKMKKEAAEYKAQLLKKEHEAEEYRKQLEKLKNCNEDL